MCTSRNGAGALPSARSVGNLLHYTRMTWWGVVQTLDGELPDAAALAAQSWGAISWATD